MKRLAVATITLLICILSFGQQPIKFLGIPVDGRESDMVFKLKQKGFKQHSFEDHCLVGTFNGRPSYVFIHTNKNKVDRIMVVDQEPISKRQVKVLYNNLLQQFEENGKYLSIGNEPIPDDEDIFYEMRVNNKEYAASFYPDPLADEDANAEYIQEVKERASHDIIKALEAGEIEDTSEDGLIALSTVTFLKLIVNDALGMVWMNITENTGDYNIAIFYDNFANQAHGEDL